MNAGFVWLTATKDLRRRMQDPWSLAFWLGMPVMIVTLILLAFGGGSGRTPVAKVLVVDRDSTFVSGLVMQALGRAPTVDAEYATATAARRQLDDGKVSATLQIPKGFGQAFFDRTPTTLVLRTNPAQRILPGMVEETLGLLTDAGFYAQQIFDEELEAIGEGPPPGRNTMPNATVNMVSTGINDKVGRIQEFAFPPVIEVHSVVDSTRTGPSPSLGAMFFPGVLLMALLFMASGMAGDVWVERKAGTLRRAVTSPQRLSDFLAGKVLAGMALMAVVSFVALVIGVLGVGVAAANVPLAVVWTTFSGTVFLLVIMLIHLFASSARTAGVLSTMIIFPLLMVGGSFFPFDSMPGWLAAIGRMTPNGWALTQLEAIMTRSADPTGLGMAFVGLLVVAAVAFSVAVLRLRRGFAVT